MFQAQTLVGKSYVFDSVTGYSPNHYDYLLRALLSVLPCGLFLKFGLLNSSLSDKSGLARVYNAFITAVCVITINE